MRILKIFLIIFSVFIILAIGILAYLIQPSGTLAAFKTWHYQLPTQSTTDAHSAAPYHVKFFGVSTLLFDDGQAQILIDGFFSRPSLSQTIFTQIQSDQPLLHSYIDQYDLKRTRAIFVTHSHYDHALDIPMLAHQLPKAMIVGSKSTLNIARAMPIAESQLHEVQAWQPMQIGKFTITAIPSQHTPPTAVNDDLGEEISQPLQLPAHFSQFKEGGSYDYLIQHGPHYSLVKASTGAVPKQLQKLEVDTLFLGIAQLSKQTTAFQQQYFKETLATLQPNTVIPIHWDNFFKPLNPELEFLPRFADDTPQSLNLLIQSAAAQNTKVVLLSQPVSFELKNSGKR